MVAHAGLDAAEATLADRRGITLPLAFEIVKNLSALLSAPATLPAHLPAAMVLKLRSMGECIGLGDGAVEYIAAILADAILETKGGAADLFATLWEIPDPETTDALDRNQSGPLPSTTGDHDSRRA